MSELSVSIDHGICRIGFNRPGKRNTLDAATCVTLVSVLHEAIQDETVRCVVFTTEHGVFCAGTDLQESLTRSEATQEAYNALIEALAAFDKPMLAAVTGPCVGLGVAILYFCDIVYCSEKALFSMPFTALGLTPEFGLTHLTVAKAGMQKAAEKLLLSEPINAAEAYDMGIVTGVVKEDGKVLEQLLQRAARFTQLPPQSVRATKRLLRMTQASLLRSAINREQVELVERLAGDEAREATEAFEQGRKPDFSHK